MFAIESFVEGDAIESLEKMQVVLTIHVLFVHISKYHNTCVVINNNAIRHLTQQHNNHHYILPIRSVNHGKRK